MTEPTTEQGPKPHKASDVSKKGPLAWAAKNTVFANLLMVVFIVGGLLMAGQVKQEVFPEVDLDIVTVQVPYPGAGPEEVEQGVVLAVEEAIRGVDGIKEVRSTAAEGVGVVTAELMLDTNDQEALNDIKSEVDRITSFPEDSERPIISLSSNRREVLSIILHGDIGEKKLHQLAEQMRSELLAKENISLVEITGIPEPEISIEVPQENLRRFDLTLPEVADAVREASIELPGGAVRTEKGEILLRTTERRKQGEEFLDIVVKSQPDGTEVTVGDLGMVFDEFRETDREAYYDGERALSVQVFRVGDQSPLDISETVHEYLDGVDLPPNVDAAIWNDRSEIFDSRINLLIKNAALGLLLVIVLLGLLLEARLAFWVTLGIPISFLGAFLFMPALDVSINMISLFAFILTLGIVVDDAIVAGEAAYAQREEGRSKLEASIAGVREVARPVVFAVLTTIIAFTPMLFVPGVSGKFFRNIPLIVIPILLISLVEALAILPAHLAHVGDPAKEGVLAKLHGYQQKIGGWLESFVENVYYPSAKKFLRYRYITLAASIGLLVLAGAYVYSGRISFNFMPKIEGDEVSVSLEMPFGTAVETTREATDRLIREARAVLDDAGGADKIGRGIYADVGTVAAGGGPDAVSTQSGGHLAQVTVSLVDAGQRDITASQLTKQWRERVGEIPGAESLRFQYSIGASAGEPVAIELRHEDRRILEEAASRLAEHLETYNGVFDIDDGFQRGKEQLDLTLKPAARALGITESELARQVRSHFFGAEAKREQRGRHELRVYVRRPERERETEHTVENLLIRTRDGGEIPLDQAAYIERGHSYTSIEREGGGRVVDVTADVDTDVTSGNEVTASLEQNYLPELLADYPGLSYELTGEQQEQAETMAALGKGFLIALLVMFALMAIAFRSYAQPIVVLFAIPFGLVGALGGHMLMGYDLSLISILGIVALAGVVVNDSLVLIAAVNDYRREGRDPLESVASGGARRFRPILLTSLTTFFGLMPMILETSVQARFLIPMAISLGFGVLFVTVITLVIVPAAYMAVEDVKQLSKKAKEAVT
ncbi:efflux RND transporter permease subunit [Persicimonas caeni]|uniref:Efflux RND transporter permease subunit n=1 Tax=Persicimonas caeni TaxID=2292766 RepID=A0A4Y6Q101_PERCE|nr:efflux RND transporter permease subunit [Persicimonas caeni]QDG54202.1 efflux RND transporter permease subunit [Persicimonas caeni]QED35423.1 efflux RND transporter permease subunit [Persicimonas caeni]